MGERFSAPSLIQTWQVVQAQLPPQAWSSVMSIVQRDVENRLFLAVIFIWQFAVLELDGLTFGQECNLNLFSPGASSVTVPAHCDFSSDILSSKTFSLFVA